MSHNNQLDASNLGLSLLSDWPKIGKLALFKPKVNIYIETDKYIVKTASKLDELLALFRLRYKIFFDDRKNSLFSLRLDIESFDFNFDHIIILDKDNEQVVGTYRLNCSLYAKSFYSEYEFNLDSFLNKTQGDVLLELGRACIDTNYRNGTVLNLLWRGIAAYSQETNTKYLFGCTSIMTIDQSTIEAVDEYLLSRDYFSNQYDIFPQDKYLSNIKRNRLSGNNANESCEQFIENDIKQFIPPLLKTYMLAGAKIYGQPAFDKDFGCYDYLTILNLQKLTPSFARHYFTN